MEVKIYVVSYFYIDRKGYIGTLKTEVFGDEQEAISAYDDYAEKMKENHNSFSKDHKNTISHDHNVHRTVGSNNMAYQSSLAGQCWMREH